MSSLAPKLSIIGVPVALSFLEQMLKSVVTAEKVFILYVYIYKYIYRERGHFLKCVRYSYRFYAMQDLVYTVCSILLLHFFFFFNVRDTVS